MSVSLYGSGQTVIQVQSTTVTTSFSASVGNNSFTNFTGLSVSITPQSTTSKILIIVNTVSGSSSTGTAAIQVLRGSTVVGNGTSGVSINAISASWAPNSFSNYTQIPMVAQFLDSPATTSSLTYQLQVGGDTGGSYVFGRRGVDTNWGTSSTITVMEISGS